MRQLKISKSITGLKSSSLGLYFREISKKQLLKEDEEVGLVKRIREGDPLEIFTDKEGEVILKKY